MERINSDSRSVIGNLTIEPTILRQFLKKSCYYITYEADQKRILFWANDGNGGKTIMEIDCASHENAEKIANGLGLKQEGESDSWSVWNPKLYLDHDGSPDAEELRMEMLRLGIPYELRKSDKLALIEPISGMGHRYTAPTWTKEKMLEIIRKTAKANKKELAAVP